jgi:N-acyl-D-aspartate/D-glutamate deacylase
MAADLCVIAPGGPAARATYGAPQLPAAGVDLVLVNGVITWRGGQPVTDDFPGRMVS